MSQWIINPYRFAVPVVNDYVETFDDMDVDDTPWTQGFNTFSADTTNYVKVIDALADGGRWLGVRRQPGSDVISAGLWTAIGELDDFDMLIRGRISHKATSKHLGLVFRAASSGVAGYILCYGSTGGNANEFDCRYTGGPSSYAGITGTGDSAFTFSAGSNVRARVNCDGSSIRARTWIDGDPEPGTWMIDGTDSTRLTGYVGTYVKTTSSAGATLFSLDWIAISNDPDVPAEDPTL